MPYAPTLIPLDVVALGEGEPLVIDGLLGEASARDVRAAVLDEDARGGLRPAGLGRARDQREHMRSDRNGWIDPSNADPRLAPLLRAFTRLRTRLRREAYLGLSRFEVQAALYREGAGYVRHVDAFRGGPSRRLTAIYYANPDWTPDDGGQLMTWSGTGPRSIEPRADRLVAFLSERLEHEVRPVTGGLRVAVTAWYWGP